MFASEEASTAATEVLAGGGEMGALMRSIDWSRTPVGPVESWPQSLRTALSILLANGFPMYIAWGPQFTQFYNDGYRPILGATKHPAAMGRGTPETFPEIWDVIGPMFRDVMRGKPVFLKDFELPLDRNGFSEECYFEFSYSPIREESGSVGGVLCTVTETTERVLAARRLQTVQELASKTQDAKSADDACHTAMQVLSKNPSDIPAAALYLLSDDGKQARYVCGTGAGAIPDTIDPAAGWHRAMSALPGHVVALPVARPGESRSAGMLLAATSVRLVFDDKYRTFLDLVAAQLATSIASARALEEAEARAAALAEIDRAKTAFFSNVSHEFRTPLTLLLGPAQDALASARTLPADDVQRWQLVQRNGQRLLKLVNNLLDFSRIESGRMQAAYEPVDLVALTADLASVFRSAIESAGLKLELALEPPGEPVYVDREMWEKIVLNLLSNALKFTFEGVIRVALRSQGGRAVLTVSDTGTGIPESELPLIFDRFHRVHGARSRTHEGTGIGLSLVRELVALHDGEVRAESTLGEGTTFTVTLPFGSAHLPRERIVPASAPASVPVAEAFIAEALRWGIDTPSVHTPVELPAVELARSDERVLIADDNADMREYLQRLLSTRFRVTTAVDGAAALEAVRREPPDLVLSDVMMPRLDGFGLLAALRADERTSSIPVVLVSARAGEEAQVEARKASADDYLVKPFSAKELIARVTSQLSRSKLRQVEQRHREELKRLFRGAPVLICLLRGPRHVFELANDAYVSLVGREVVGKPLLEALPEIEGQGFLELLDGVYRTGEPYVGNEVRFVVRKPGEESPTETFITFTYEPFRNAAGEIDGVAVFGFDLTEMVLARRNAEALVAQAQLADRRKDEFLAMLGHELRNPLAPIATAVKLMELRGDERSKREREVIARQVEHLSRLVDDLLDVSRIAQGKIQLSRKQVDIAEIAAKAVEMASPLLENRAHELQIEVPRGELFVDGDPVRLAQCIGNLLTNAAKYTPKHGHVLLSAEREGDEVVVRVKDDGTGIVPEMLPRVFDLFVQGARAIDRREGGLGLGLAVVKNLIALHGGTVSAQSEGAGLGSEFEVRLPALREGVREGAPVRAGQPRRTQRGCRVLVVDDNVDAAEVLADTLHTMGHEVAVAHDGAEALQVQEQFHADVGVLDLGLPVMDGYELASQMRRREGGRVRLIALTGYGQDQDRARSRDAGFDAHLVKPVELRELTDLIAKMS